MLRIYIYIYDALESPSQAPKSFLRGTSSPQPATLSFSNLTLPAGDGTPTRQARGQKDEHEFRLGQVLESWEGRGSLKPEKSTNNTNKIQKTTTSRRGALAGPGGHVPRNTGSTCNTRTNHKKNTRKLDRQNPRSFRFTSHAYFSLW